MNHRIRHLIFIRHGQSEHHVKGLTGGWTDTPLTSVGREQVAVTARRLQKWNLEQVAFYASDLKRAAETADIIGSKLGIRAQLLPELREIGNGVAAGLSLEAAEQIQSPEPEGADPDWRPYAGAETWREMSDRIGAALSTFDEQAATVLVVGHGNSGQALANAWLGWCVESRMAFQFGPASVSEFRINQWGEREMVHINLRFDTGLTD